MSKEWKDVEKSGPRDKKFTQDEIDFFASLNTEPRKIYKLPLIKIGRIVGDAPMEFPCGDFVSGPSLAMVERHLVKVEDLPKFMHKLKTV